MGRGLFSLISGITCHLHLADLYGMIPIIDLLSNRCEYQEDDPDNYLSRNCWENYFEPVSDLSLLDAELAPLSVYSQDGYPSGYPFSISSDKDLCLTFSKYIKPRDLFLDRAIDFINSHFGSRNLAVHYRAQEMRTAFGHWYPPSYKQITKAIDYCLDNRGFDKIFVVSEDIDCIKTLKNRYGVGLISTNHYRTSSPVNAYKIYPRRNHKYLLGAECLLDTILLSHCQGFVRCTSNIAEGARLLKKIPYEIELKINNGPNNARIWKFPLYKFSWTYKNIAPEWAGGFSQKSLELATSRGFVMLST